MELIMNNLNVIWFILLCVLFAGFFFLEGFDYGTGILLPVIGKTDVERRQMINALGPIWDGNEVWMITAGGALFASFPHVYYCIFIGSIVPALLWGVTVGNLIQGTPIDETMTYIGTFWDLLSPYTVLCGVAFILVFTYHGGLFTSIKTAGPISERARAASLVTGVPTAIGVIALIIASDVYTDLYSSILATIFCALAVVCFLISWAAARTRNTKWGFVFSSLSVILITATYFAGLFPRIMVSSLNPAWSLTITNASSSEYTLALMTAVAVVFVPIVLAYQIWVYWTFRHRVTEKDLHY